MRERNQDMGRETEGACQAPSTKIVLSFCPPLLISYFAQKNRGKCQAHEKCVVRLAARLGKKGVRAQKESPEQCIAIRPSSHRFMLQLCQNQRPAHTHRLYSQDSEVEPLFS